jgi:hypothetical protein
MTRDDDCFAGLPEGSRLNLVEAQLGALYEVGSVISRSLNLRETLREVLTLLNDRNRLSYGMVCLVDQETGELLVSALHNEVPLPFEAVRYRPGEGVIGRILERNETWILPRVGDETRFLDRLGVYNRDLPFIGVPIRVGEEGGAVGVFAAQPTSADLLEPRARFLEMVANLSDRHGERSEAGWPPVGVGRGRAAAVAEGPLGPEAAKAVCKRIRHAVKPFAQGSWRGAASRRRARAVLMLRPRSGADRGTEAVAERKAKGRLGRPVSHPEHGDTPGPRAPSRNVSRMRGTAGRPGLAG